ncbi:MAG: DUF6364 family protein, partial [Vulcanimicrobiaceae bacterium]
MAKISKNLSLDDVAVARGERYSQLHETNLSRLVSDFLAQLPVDEREPAVPPTVRRLIGVGARATQSKGEPRGRQLYRRHLET